MILTLKTRHFLTGFIMLLLNIIYPYLYPRNQHNIDPCH
jgi:hypothetical protein